MKTILDPLSQLDEIAKSIEARLDDDSFVEIANGVKNIANALEKQAKATRYRHS